MANNEQEVLQVDVGRFVETLLERQAAFESEVRARLDATDAKIAEVFELQQLALKDALATLHTLIEGKTAWRRPAGPASTN